MALFEIDRAALAAAFNADGELDVLNVVSPDTSFGGTVADSLQAVLRRAVDDRAVLCPTGYEPLAFTHTDEENDALLCCVRHVETGATWGVYLREVSNFGTPNIDQQARTGFEAIYEALRAMLNECEAAVRTHQTAALPPVAPLTQA